MPFTQLQISQYTEGDIDELLQNSDALCLTNQRMDYLNTLFKYPFSKKNFVKSGKMFDKVQTVEYLDEKIRGVDKKLSILRKGLLRKKYNHPSLSALKRTKSKQRIRSVFAERFDPGEKTKPEMD